MKIIQFSKILRDLREERKIKQKELADIMGVSQATISMWEKNASEPDIDKIRRLSNYFGVSTDYLLGLED